MKLKRSLVVFDSADLETESAFWAKLLDGTVEKEDGWHTVLVDGKAQLAVQFVRNHVPPQRRRQQQQLHLDLYVEDILASHTEAIAAGARLLKAAKDLSSPHGFQVYADPSGHPFCLCWN